MKAIKIIGIVLTIVIVVFFSLGIFVPSYEYQSSIEVNASAEKCWKVYHNVKLMNQWLQGFESLTLKSGDSLATGSQYEIVITDDGHRMVSHLPVSQGIGAAGACEDERYRDTDRQQSP